MGELKLSDLAKDTAMIDYLMEEIANCFMRMGDVFEQMNMMSPPPEGGDGAEVGLREMAKQFRDNQQQYRSIIIDLMPERDAILNFIESNKLAYGWLQQKPVE